MEDIDPIDRAERLVAVFGYWPTFHDAEVLWLRLDRRSPGEGSCGPALDAFVHVFEITPEVGLDGHYVQRHHMVAHLRFHEVVELRLDGFKHRNALSGIDITDLRDRQLERVTWAARFVSAFGADVSFSCRAVEVLSVVPCCKAGELLPAESRHAE